MTHRSYLRPTALLVLLGEIALAQPAEELAARAAQAMREKDYANAEQAYRQLVKLTPHMAEAHSNLGLACYLQQKIPCAEQAFQKSLEYKQDLFLPNFVLGRIRFQQERYPEALVLVDRAVQQQQHAEVRQLLAAILVGLKRYERAIDQYRTMLQENPSDGEAYYGLGRIYLELSRTAIQRLEAYKDRGYDRLLVAEHNAPYEQWRPLALDSYKDAIGRAIPVKGVRVAYARLLMLQRDWAGAQKSLEDELRLDPHSYDARFELARVALAQGDAATAMRNLDEAVRIRPEFFRPLPELGLGPESQKSLGGQEEFLCKQASEGRFGAAFLLSSLRANDSDLWRERAESARRTILAEVERQLSTPGSSGTEERGYDLLQRKRYEKGLELLLPLARKRALRTKTQLETARSLHRQGRFEDLVGIFGGTVAAEPEISYLLGLSYKELALEKLSRMVELYPDSARAHQVLGEAYFLQEMYPAAISEYELALKIEPKNSELYFALGNSYYKQMQFSLAVDNFDRAIRLDPLNAEAHLMRGDALVQMGETASAIPSLKKSLELNPKLERAHVLLGKALGAAGKLEEALVHMEKGAAADHDGSVYYQLFVLYRKLQRPREAEEALRKCQEIRQASAASK